MVVMPGNKQSEAGVIPEDWNTRSAGSIGRFRGGNGFPTALQGKTAGDYPFFKVSDMNSAGNETQMTVAKNYISESARKTLGATVFPKNAIVFAKIGAAVHLERKKVLIGPSCIDNNMAGFVVEDDEIDYRFVRHFLLGYKLGGLAATTALPSLSGSVLRSIQIPCPPTRREQEAIATALSDADALIQSLEALIIKKRQVKQGAMQELLTGKRRIVEGSIATDIVSDSLGLRPSDWRLSKLVEIVEPSRGIRYGIVQPGRFDPNGRYMLRGQDYSESKGWADPNEVFRVSAVVEEPFRNARVREGDLIMTIVGYCGHVESVPGWLDGANLTQTTARIAIQREIASPIFCKYMLQGPVGKHQVAAFIKGAAQPGLNCGDVENFLLPLPSLIEQSAIAEFLSAVDAEIYSLGEKVTKIRMLKQGMMQVLLTGQIRLPLDAAQ